MMKLVSFRCEECGAEAEGWDDETHACEQCGGPMAILPFKKNFSRWRHRDVNYDAEN